MYTVRPIKISAPIPAPPDKTFAYVSDTRNDPEWCSNVSDVDQTSGNGVELGATFEFRQKIEVRGQELVSDVSAEVVELGERHIRWRVEDRFQIRDVLLKVDENGPGSKVTQTTTAAFRQKPGLARWLYPLLARRTFKDQFRHLGERFAH